MKSPFLAFSLVDGLLLLLLLWNRDWRFSFRPPIIFSRFFFSFSSSRTRAVSIAVAAFLMPAPEVADEDDDGWVVVVDASTDSACFFRFFEPGAFLSECVRPCSASFCARAIRRSFSTSFVVRMGMTLSSV